MPACFWYPNTRYMPTTVDVILPFKLTNRSKILFVNLEDKVASTGMPEKKGDVFRWVYDFKALNILCSPVCIGRLGQCLHHTVH